MSFVNLGEWTPDSPQHVIGSISDLNNVIPDVSAYTSVPTFKPVTGPIIEDGEVALITGSQSFYDADGNVHTFAGTNKGLYRLTSQASWENVSKEGGYNGLGHPWQFVIYGDLVIATNYQDPIQCVNVKGGGPFEDLSETAPRARTLAIVNEFLFLGDTVDTYDNERPGRVWWGPIANPRGVWEPNQTTMCDYQDIGQGVSVVRIVGGESAKIFMKTAVVRGTFVGSPIVFQFDVIEPARGCVGINALTNIGEAVYFLSHDGFYALTTGSSTPVGLNKVDKYILDRLPGGALSLAQCAYDPRHKLIWWSFPTATTNPSDTTILDLSIVLHWPTGKWGKTTTPFRSLHSLQTRGYTLDELDEINKVLDELPFPLDSVMYKGGVPILGCFDLNGCLGYGYGEPISGYVTTSDAPYADHEARMFIRRVRPAVDGTSKTHTMQISGKQSLYDLDAFTAEYAYTRIGDFPCRKSGRYHKIKFHLNGDWYQFSGYSIIGDKEGTQ